MACFIPVQGLMGFGAANLNPLTGGSAYGIPRYSYTDLPFGRASILPITAPDSVWTTGEFWISSGSARVDFEAKRIANVTTTSRGNKANPQFISISVSYLVIGVVTLQLTWWCRVFSAFCRVQCNSFLSRSTTEFRGLGKSHSCFCHAVNVVIFPF